MPVTFHSLGSVDSIAGSFRSDTLSTPPVSHRSFDDIPFKPPDYDHVSLNMKKSRNHRRGPHDIVSRRAAGGRTRGRGKKKRGSGSHLHPRSLRKTRSLPSVQPRFDHGTVETLQTCDSSQWKSRRWTVPSKAASTCALATLVPVGDPGNKSETGHHETVDSTKSPAMITLRRATALRSRRQTTLTSFPPPKFSRDSSGLLSTFLCSITGYDEATSCTSTKAEPVEHIVSNTTKPSTIDSNSDVHPTTSMVAPPVHTQVVAVEPRLSISGPNQALASIRRCSTRYVSENAVYEIIWDENWSSSESSGSQPGSHGRGSILQSRELAGADSLERRLSNALDRSQHASFRESKSRRTSHILGHEFSTQSIWTNPKIAGLSRELPSEGPPHSWFPSRQNTARALPDSTLEEEVEQAESTDHFEFFPPLGSHGNTNGVEPSMGSGAAEASEPCQEDLKHPMSRSRYGSNVGISSHTKRKSMSTASHGQGCRRQSTKIRSRRASEINRRANASDDESVPLLRSD